MQGAGQKGWNLDFGIFGIFKIFKRGGGKWQPFLEPWNHTPPKYGARNSQISQMVLEGQDGYQTVRLVFLINLIYLYIDRKGLKLRRLWF